MILGRIIWGLQGHTNQNENVCDSHGTEDYQDNVKTWDKKKLTNKEIHFRLCQKEKNQQTALTKFRPETPSTIILDLVKNNETIGNTIAQATLYATDIWCYNMQQIAWFGFLNRQLMSREITAHLASNA